MNKLNGIPSKKINLKITRAYTKTIYKSFVCPEEIYDEGKVDDFVASYFHKNKEDTNESMKKAELYNYDEYCEYEVIESRCIGEGHSDYGDIKI
jgi:hypothetical protein